jgi:hypothetical protein
MEENMENKTSLLRSPYLWGGLIALGVFVLCFVAIDYVSRPETEEIKVENQVIATLQTNEPLIAIARQQGWIDTDATEMTSVDASRVTSIDSVFQGSKLTTFDEFRFFVGLQEIPAEAFAHSDLLTAITLPPRVNTIADGALAYCPNLLQIKVDTANTHFDSRDDCNAVICTWKGDLKVVAGCRNTKIPAKVRYLSAKAFCGCQGLTAVAFPERMDEIGPEAFRDCRDLTAIEIPQGVRFVEESTFAGCTALRSVVLSKSVERLRNAAFTGCTNLTEVTCPKKYPPIVENAFDGFTATVYVPAGMLNKYYVDKVWKNFQNIKELAE